ncbi:Lrp/AsnC family transcriptional regulator [Mycolicibacterium helvum]|uniref:AsnC family transcriptional regulator n=1 Tax=Mycolicibacterium helvum TaxID=1534349 RepID=A0A7I7T6B5_9MYCO|nr:Lrp/AsnC family transcriptional regulator [Mycolicibacterium helvum]BBY64019.1 AsnC family transcriptional regulator [Mycolicibacterium helvum]
MGHPGDGLILHALQLYPRVSFRRIAEVTGLSEQTVSRRYHQLRRDGVLRVAGMVNPRVLGAAQWVARIRVKPDRVAQLADALIRRPDIGYTSIQSGGAELLCIIRAPKTAGRNPTLLQQLPRSAAVLDISVDLMLHSFGDATTTVWTAYGEKLTSTQARQVVEGRYRHEEPADGAPTAPTGDDAPLLVELARDGRASHAELARATGWSVPRVARHLTALERSGTLLYDVDILPEQMGYHVNAILWLTLPPEHTHAVGNQLATHDEVAFVAAITGRSNLMAVVICRDEEDLYRYLAGRFAAVRHLATYDISVRTEQLKQSTSLVTHGRLINATPRTTGT